jgi:hypothetical protein
VRLEVVCDGVRSDDAVINLRLNDSELVLSLLTQPSPIVQEGQWLASPPVVLLQVG